MAGLSDDAQWIVMMGFVVSLSFFFLALLLNQSTVVGQTTAESVLDFPKNDIRDVRSVMIQSAELLNATTNPISVSQYQTIQNDIQRLSLSEKKAVVQYQIINPSPLWLSIHYNNGVTRLMKPGSRRKNHAENGVSTLIEYVMITTIMVILFVVVLLEVNSNFMQGPAETLQYNAFTDIGNGISTRIVDVYAIAPTTGNITSSFTLPDEVAGQDYFVNIYTGATEADQGVRVYQGNIMSNISIAGISSTRNVTGNTTGSGIQQISYDSAGF